MAPADDLQFEIAEYKRLLDEAIRHKDGLAAMYSIALDLLNHRSVDDVLSRIIYRASELLDAPWALFDLVVGDTLVIKHGTKMAESLIGHTLPIKDAVMTRLAVETREPQIEDDYLSKVDRLKLHDPFHLRAACTFPIVVNGKVLGALSLGRTVPNKPFTPDDMELMYSMADLAGMALENANLFEETQRQSLTDSLTGLANRRCFDATLEDEWKRAERTSKPLALIMLDIDFFKNYNDAYGHAQGDECLRKIGEVLKKSARRTFDLPARYGGEEFAVILPGVNLANVKRLAENIRAAIEELNIPHTHSEIAECVTVSAGVSTMIPKGKESSLKLIVMADNSLYKAKHTGKNKVCHVRDSSASAPTE